ncbi:MAG: DUF2857 domain-containing protein [Gammaproteobacteria bacterium]|nr:DUF2857 domain-containing protein [Gammaproteobacteria bacterium]
MIGTKESVLFGALLWYATRCVAEGDYPVLRAMRFGPKEIEALGDLRLDDLHRMGSVPAHCLAITLDRKLFWRMMERLVELRASSELQEALIKADASKEMMRHYFGLAGREITRRRRTLAPGLPMGRPPEPDEDTARRLWRELAPRLESSGPGGLGPETVLEIHRKTGAPVRAVWAAVQQWTEDNGPRGSGGGQSDDGGAGEGW